ncbi:MAG: hypothetical protein ABWZ39_05880, partial [Pseudomonas caspiana]
IDWNAGPHAFSSAAILVRCKVLSATMCFQQRCAFSNDVLSATMTGRGSHRSESHPVRPIKAIEALALRDDRRRRGLALALADEATRQAQRSHNQCHCDSQFFQSRLPFLCGNKRTNKPCAPSAKKQHPTIDLIDHDNSNKLAWLQPTEDEHLFAVFGRNRVVTGNFICARFCHA